MNTPPSLINKPAIDARLVRRRMGIVLVCAIAVVAFGWRITKRTRLIRAIESAGGYYQETVSGPNRSPLIAKLLGGPARYESRDVSLYGVQFNDDWLTSWDSLSALRLTSVSLQDTQISRAGVAEVLGRHELLTLIAQKVDLRDEDIDLLNREVGLSGLDLSGSQITDEGLQRLNLPSLQWLSLRDSPMTDKGIASWLSSQTMVNGLILDGRQLTSEFAELLAQRATFKEVHLYGDAVTSEHLEWLAGVPSLKQVDLYDTPITQEAAEEFAAAHRHLQWRMRMSAPDGSLIQLHPKVVQ